MKIMNYLVVSINDANEYYNIDDFTELILEMYSQELVNNEYEVVRGWFFKNYKVFIRTNDSIIELTEDIE
jgi:hypothetical protein